MTEAPVGTMRGEPSRTADVRVLVIEDERRIADSLAKGLRADGLVVDIASDGTQGLGYANQGPYDAIVLDIMLPDLSGYDVLRRLRASQVHTPVLVLTAKDREYDEVGALDLGADDYLTKPFSYPVVLAHLRALVRRGRQARPAVLTVGRLRFDPGLHHCERNGVTIALTAREGELIAYLMRHADRVVSKADLLAGVWDTGFAGDPNIVEVYIGYLRKKIDRPFGLESIETVRGVGYRLRGSQLR
jgi:DNA-binding response OmpR family regulator